MKPLFGEGLTGLKNLGNSCYLSSILQCLFSISFFQNRYYHPEEPPPASAHPADDLETQLRKLADGLLSGRYSRPDTNVIASEYSPELPHQKGLAPAMLKHLVGRGHEEFSTMRQQDAFEFLLHLFKLITRSAHPASLQDPVQSFRFVMEQRLQCINCRKVRYRTDEQDNISIPVPVRRKLRVVNGEPGEEKPKDEFEPVTLKECLDAFTDAEMVELTCPACGSQDGFTKRSMFKTFPAILAVNARRFELVNWVPTKLDVPVEVGDEQFDMGLYQSAGIQEGEELLPDVPAEDDPSGFSPNSTALNQLESMGFPRNRCLKALHATGNSDADAAMTWLFSHMEDPDIDDPLIIDGGKPKTSAGDIRPEDIEALGAMGISTPQARKALKETNGDVNRALDWVFSHPDDQGDFGDDGNGADISTSAPKEEDDKPFPGNGDLPAKFQLQSIVCHKGASIHAGYVAIPSPDCSKLPLTMRAVTTSPSSASRFPGKGRHGYYSTTRKWFRPRVTWRR
jgi:ubiquitin carboxyl-terminal hydrolase 5/13